MEKLNENAKISFILSIIALISAFLSPLIAFVLAALGIVMSKKGRESERSDLASLGFKLSVAAIVVGVVHFIFVFVALILFTLAMI